MLPDRRTVRQRKRDARHERYYKQAGIPSKEFPPVLHVWSAKRWNPSEFANKKWEKGLDILIFSAMINT